MAVYCGLYGGLQNIINQGQSTKKATPNGMAQHFSYKVLFSLRNQLLYDYLAFAIALAVIVLFL